LVKSAGRPKRARAKRALRALDGPLQDIKYMAEVAAELADQLSREGAQVGFFQIQVTQGNRLGFCCNDILRRVDELLESVTDKAK
jgi:hypothetical protein